MVVALPTQVTSSLVNRLRHIAEVGSYVVLECLTADVLQQLLELRNLCNTGAAETSQEDRQ